MVRRGASLSAEIIRTASMVAATPAPLSVAPVPECQESMCAPSMTIWSFKSVPGISATVLYAIRSSSLNFTFKSTAIFSFSPCSIMRAIRL